MNDRKRHKKDSRGYPESDIGAALGYPHAVPAAGGCTLQSVGLNENPYHSLFRCNQFVLGPQFAPGLDNWTQFVVGPRLRLTVHPTLNVVQVESGARKLSLLGVLLDPDAPDEDDHRILTRLMERFESLDALIAATGSLGGRWVIVAVHGKEAHLFNDAFGLRQVFYAKTRGGDVFAMSEAALGAKMLSLPVGRAAQTYMNSEVFRADPEYQWPTTATAFRGLKRLVPNHSLDLRHGVSRRFWPTAPLSKLTLDEGATRAGRLLRGLVRAAANRFDLAISVTCGIDSRVVLAASRDAIDRASFVTLRQCRMPDENPDIAIPAELLAKLGLEHEVVQARVTMTPEFGHIFKASAFLAHDRYGPDAEAILERFDREKVALTGSGGEVARCAGRNLLPFFDRKRASPAYLARSKLGGRSAFAERYFRKWLRDVGSGHDVNLMDIFEWEQDCGSWLAATQLEFDMAWKDVITPFNCRDLMVAMLSVPSRYRKGLKPALFERIIQDLWPEILDAPVNPHKQPSSAMRGILGSLVQLLRHTAHLFRYRRDLNIPAAGQHGELAYTAARQNSGAVLSATSTTPTEWSNRQR